MNTAEDSLRPVSFGSMSSDANSGPLTASRSPDARKRHPLELQWAGITKGLTELKLPFSLDLALKTEEGKIDP